MVTGSVVSTSFFYSLVRGLTARFLCLLLIASTMTSGSSSRAQLGLKTLLVRWLDGAYVGIIIISIEAPRRRRRRSEYQNSSRSGCVLSILSPPVHSLLGLPALMTCLRAVPFPVRL